MSDDLVKRLWLHDCEGITREAADRIEELEAELSEQVEWVKSLADDLIAAEGREARLKEKLAEAVEFISNLKQYAVAIDDRHLHTKAVTTLAELTGGQKDE